MTWSANLLACLLFFGCGGATDSHGDTARTVREVEIPAVFRDGDWRRRYARRRALATLEGRASYYADSLEGNHTANGERYDPRAFTAANRELPFGTVLRVIRVDTGTSVIVRVNDRGPFGGRGRILDLSRAAAESLDMIRRGVITVRAEILEYGEGRRATAQSRGRRRSAHPRRRRRSRQPR